MESRLQPASAQMTRSFSKFDNLAGRTFVIIVAASIAVHCPSLTNLVICTRFKLFLLKLSNETNTSELCGVGLFPKLSNKSQMGTNTSKFHVDTYQ